MKMNRRFYGILAACAAAFVAGCHDPNAADLTVVGNTALGGGKAAPQYVLPANAVFDNAAPGQNLFVNGRNATNFSLIKRDPGTGIVILEIVSDSSEPIGSTFLGIGDTERMRQVERRENVKLGAEIVRPYVDALLPILLTRGQSGGVGTMTESSESTFDRRLRQLDEIARRIEAAKQ